MNTSRSRLFTAITLIALLLSACTEAATVEPTATTAPPPPTATPTPPPPEHRIGVRQVDGVGEFYDRQTGEKFTPRGSNYIRLAEQLSLSGNMMIYHSTFNVGLYDAQGAEQALAAMAANGYNVVRVFLNGNCAVNCIGNPAIGLNPKYVANLADFLARAKAHSIYVILTTDSEPGTPYYIQMLDTTWSESFGGTNSQILRQGGILVATNFWQDLIEELIEQKAPLDAIFAYALRNELYFDGNIAPLSLTSGTVDTANGQTYNMVSEADKQRMLEEGLVYYMDTVRAAILESDPTALVTVGFFVPQSPNLTRVGDTRLAVTAPAIHQSQADFIDLHLYPGFGLTLAQYAENFGMDGAQEKPILMGEFGAGRGSFKSEAWAARGLHDWQVESCALGFDGWLTWTWNLSHDVDFYNELDGQGEISQVLAPVNRSDPCQAGDFIFFEFNLALGKEVTASQSLQGPPSAVVDGDLSTQWGAGAPPPQWIQIDLGEVTSIGIVRLYITQYPNGDTKHEIMGGPTVDQLASLHIFEGATVSGQVLEYRPDAPVENIRYLRVRTRRSPSWVGWLEIEILKP